MVNHPIQLGGCQGRRKCRSLDVHWRLARLENHKYRLACEYLPSVPQLDGLESSCVRRGWCGTPRTTHCRDWSSKSYHSHAHPDHTRRIAGRVGRSRGKPRCAAGTGVRRGPLKTHDLASEQAKSWHGNQPVPPANRRTQCSDQDSAVCHGCFADVQVVPPATPHGQGSRPCSDRRMGSLPALTYTGSS